MFVAGRKREKKREKRREKGKREKGKGRESCENL
jgi:hypothetical protein